MANLLISKKKAKMITAALFVLGLAILTYTKSWWPGIMLAFGLPLALRQYFLGRHYDMGVSLFVFIGVFVTVQFDISWEILLPVLFTLGGIYIFFREFIESEEAPETEEEDNLNHEIEEEAEDRHPK
ncbi:MAG: hypothetical protein HKM07_07540 [Chlamydiae bacterium]|nr:hypothetical protein [Chlamydiota bacterium]